MYQLWAITSSQLDSSLTLWVYCKAEYFRSLHLYITHSLISAMYWPFNSSLSSALIANTSLLLCFNKVFLYTFVSVSAVCPLVADLSLCLWQCRQRPSYRLSTQLVLFGFLPWWRRPSTPSRSPQIYWLYSSDTQLELIFRSDEFNLN